MTAPRFGILGDLEVAVDHRRLEVGGPKQRGLLAVLLIHLNQSVSAGRLAEALWGSEPPAGAEVTLRTRVSHVRRHLASVGVADVLVTRRSGYSLEVDPEQVDAYRFERLAGLGQEAFGLADPERAAQLLRDALALWRGPVLQDLGHPLFAEAETARLEGLRLDALEARISADLALGRYDVITELERLVVDHPFRERFHGQLMLALYRAGRQADALAAYASARERLADELGLDPGPALTALETAILRGDPGLLLPGSPKPVARVKAPPDALLSSVRRDRMVGRSRELDRLCELWQEVRGGAARVALVRVARPGGRIGLASWTPSGFIGQLLKTVGQHAAPPPGALPPSRWGTEEVLRELFGERATAVETTVATVTQRFASAEHFADFFLTYYGPTYRAVERLDEAARRAFRADVIALANAANHATDGTFAADWEYLITTATKA